MKKTLEGEGTPFRMVSLLPPNLPHLPRTSPKSTRRCIAIICFALLWRVLLGEVFGCFGRLIFYNVRLHTCFVGGMCLGIMPLGVPRSRLPAPLRGSTPRQFFILSLDFRYPCRSAQDDTGGWVSHEGII